MFDVVGLWLIKHILGDIRLPDQETMDQDWRRWVARNQKLANCHEQIDFQTDFVTDLAKDCGEDFPYNLDVAEIFRAWAHHKEWFIKYTLLSYSRIPKIHEKRDFFKLLKS